MAVPFVEDTPEGTLYRGWVRESKWKGVAVDRCVFF